MLRHSYIPSLIPKSYSMISKNRCI